MRIVSTQHWKKANEIFSINQLLLNESLFAFLVVFLLPACTMAQRSFYRPNSLIVPVHDSSNQLHLSAGIGKGYELNASYAVTKQFLLFTTQTRNTWSVKKRMIIGDPFRIKRNDYSITGGVGYFAPVVSKYVRSIELLLGTGYFHVDNFWYFIPWDDYHSSLEITRAKYQNIFFQCNAVMEKEKQELTAGLRIAYSRYTYFLFYDTHANTQYIKSYYDHLWGLNVEPVLNYSILLKHIKLNIQGGLSLPLVSPTVTERDVHSFYDTTIIIQSKTKLMLPMISVLGRISLQCNLNLNRKDAFKEKQRNSFK